MTLLITLAGVTAYLAVGLGHIAPRYVTRTVEDDIRRCPTLAKDDGQIEEWRRFAASSSVVVALVWPLYLAGRALTSRIADAAPPTSYELKAENARQAARIAELERELGIGKTP